MNYSKKFERDYHWYMQVSPIFNFDGVDKYLSKRGEEMIVPDEGGYGAKQCFYSYDSRGKIIPCCEPQKLKTLFKTKGSVNLHIKMFAEDRAKGILTKPEIESFSTELQAPPWFLEAIERQKWKYYEKRIVT